MPARALGFASGLTIPGNVDLTQFVGSMVSNITAANSAISGLQANVTAANVGMKTYVDTSLASALIAASSYGNSVVAAYLPVDSTITAIQANVTAASANITSTQSNVTAANLNIASTQSNVTAANTNITAANVNISTLQTAAQYLSSNINGSIFSSNTYTGNVYTSNTYTSNAEITGNLTVGNINASGNLVMTGTDSTTIRFVRSVDSTVTTGEIYGNIDFAGEDASGIAGNTRARISVSASDDVGATDLKFYTAGSFINALAMSASPRFVVNAKGYYGGAAGFVEQVVPESRAASGGISNPASNDDSNPQSGISSIQSAGTIKSYYYYGNQTEVEIGQQFNFSYVGFTGGDRANVKLSASAVTDAPSGAAGLLQPRNDATSELEIYVQGIYVPDSSARSTSIKRLRKHWIASISYTTSTGLWTILDQQLCEPVYNSDATNWAAGAVDAGKVFLQANATVGAQSLNLRFDAPTSAAATSYITWQWWLKSRCIVLGVG